MQRHMSQGSNNGIAPSSFIRLFRNGSRNDKRTLCQYNHSQIEELSMIDRTALRY